jgi:urate oxidase
MAGAGRIAHVEAFAQQLAAHFAGRPGVSKARISAVEHRWERLLAGGRPHPHAFAQPAAECWTTRVTHDARGAAVEAGLTGLLVLKTTDSGFAGFPRDEFTTLAETDDRILATSITAAWAYRPGTTDFGVRKRIRQAMIERFAEHQSRSVQHTLYDMAEAALATCDDVLEVTVTMPNRHHLLVDLTPFGRDNPNEIFVAADRPFGLIEATVRRDRGHGG